MKRYIILLTILTTITSVAFAQLKLPGKFDSQGKKSTQEAPLKVSARVKSQDEQSAVLELRIPAQTYTYIKSDYAIPTEVKSDDLNIKKVVMPKGEMKGDDLVIKGGKNDYRYADVKVIFESSGERAGSLKLKYQLCNAATGVCAMPETIVLKLSFPQGETTTAFTYPAPEEDEGDETGLSKKELDERYPKGAYKAMLPNFKIVEPVKVGYIKADDFLAYLDKAEGKKPQLAKEEGFIATIKSVISGTFLENSGGSAKAEISLALLLGVLIGGFLLNFTPCVLPMIPVNIAIIGGGSAAAGSKGRGFALGGLYGLGIALAYGALGLIVMLTGAPFGVLNSTPWFNFAIAAIFIVLALAMFDVILIDFTQYQNKISAGKKKGSAAAAFFMGIIAALLAGACVAPVVIMVLLLAASLYAKGAVLAVLLPFLLGAGMALPWPFIGGGISVLPKPGTWMNKLKAVFGIIIILAALYYGYTGVTLLDTAPADDTEAQSSEGSKLKWEKSLPHALSLSMVEEKPVFIDFWATWCKNCKEMDKTTFKDERVVERLNNDYILLKYQAEDMNDPETKEVLQRFNVKGLPTYVILKPNL